MHSTYRPAKCPRRASSKIVAVVQDLNHVAKIDERLGIDATVGRAREVVWTRMIHDYIRATKREVARHRANRRDEHFEREWIREAGAEASRLACGVLRATVAVLCKPVVDEGTVVG